MRISFGLMASLAALAVVGCTPTFDPSKSPPSAAKIIDGIKADEVHWNADWKSGDAARIASHYAPDAVVMVPGAPRMEGTAAIKTGLGLVLQDAGHSLTFNSEKIEVAQSHDLAVSRGVYTETATEASTHNKMTTKGSFVTVYKPGADGIWKAVWDINSPGRPDLDQPQP